jgi:hypothetical protein
MKKDLGPEAMQLIAELLKTLMPPGWGFTLLTFETNGIAEKILYISSAERDSMKITMETLLDKWNTGDEFLTINPN